MDELISEEELGMMLTFRLQNTSKPSWKAWVIPSSRWRVPKA